MAYFAATSECLLCGFASWTGKRMNLKFDGWCRELSDDMREQNRHDEDEHCLVCYNFEFENSAALAWSSLRKKKSVLVCYSEIIWPLLITVNSQSWSVGCWLIFHASLSYFYSLIFFCTFSAGSLCSVKGFNDLWRECVWVAVHKY